MASLTPLSKGLIGLAVVGGMASAVWHLGLKEQLSGQAAQPAPASATVPHVQQAPSTVATPVVPPNTSITPAGGASPTDNFESGRKLLASGNFAQARVHLERAVQDGDASAACLLGDMTLKGQGGLPASQENAAKLYQLAQSRNTICFSAGQ